MLLQHIQQFHSYSLNQKQVINVHITAKFDWSLAYNFIQILGSLFVTVLSKN